VPFVAQFCYSKEEEEVLGTRSLVEYGTDRTLAWNGGDGAPLPPVLI